MNVEKWVEDRIALLEAAPHSLPDAQSVLGKLHSREQARKTRRNRLLAIGVLCLIGCAATATVITIRREPAPAQATIPQITTPAASGDAAAVIKQPVKTHDAIAVNRPAKPAQPVFAVATISPPRAFKEIGSPSAPIAFEVYTDLECPPCAAFYRDTMPRLISEYADTGKVRVVRRDFPLPQHKYARLAARYANAAGLIGRYDVVFDQLMGTQSDWAQDGDLEAPLAALLSPQDMEKIRKLVKDSPEPEESMLRDRAAGADDHVQQTPSVVIVANGKRYKISGVITYSAIKSYLDDIPSQQ
ncbi:MAG TPA: thioredoxin domain-containing protein [Bryobacteraceae bacterium]|jgi:protein-disulfide isomerase|nr:thioredoxin domain-containing protein [Bryobacteraceae bacterium]